MRLIKTSTLELHEFSGTKTPAYAILSHFWGNDEVTFQDLRDGIGSERQGWAKVVGCCDKALEDGWDFVVSYQPEFFHTCHQVNIFFMFCQCPK
jgi:hypothetical protein